VGAGKVDPSPIANNFGEPAPQQPPTIKFNFVEQASSLLSENAAVGVSRQ